MAQPRTVRGRKSWMHRVQVSRVKGQGLRGRAQGRKRWIPRVPGSRVKGEGEEEVQIPYLDPQGASP